VTCALCGGTHDTAWSDEADAWLCERCYCRLPTARERKPVGPVVHLPPSRRPKASAYQKFVEAVWHKLEHLTGHGVHYVSATQIAAYCPVCKRGTVLVTFLKLEDPGAKFTHGEDMGCSLGCPVELIAEVLR